MTRQPVVALLLLAAAACSCHDVADRKSVRSASEVSAARSDPVAAFADAPRVPGTADADVRQHVFTARGNKKGGGHKNNKMEMMHMGLSYVKMILSTFMSVIGHIFAFKSTTLTLIGVLIQIAQFVMALKKHKESVPLPTYKIVETPWHTQVAPENYGAYGGYGGFGGYAPAKTGNAPPNPSAYGQRKRR